MDVDYAEARRSDNDALPYYPMIVFSSNYPVPDLPGLIRGAGSWNGEIEPSFAIPADEAWRIMPYLHGQEAVLHLGQRYIGQSKRSAKLLWLDGSLMQTHIGEWNRGLNSLIPDGADWSQFGGQYYTITENEAE